jgi:hypothetical protein
MKQHTHSHGSASTQIRRLACEFGGCATYCHIYPTQRYVIYLLPLPLVFIMLPFVRTCCCPLRPNLVSSCYRVSFRLVHNSGKAFPLRHRDWGVVGHLSQPPSLAEEAPDGEEQGDKKKVRYQTANYRPESDPTPLRWAQHRASMKAKFPEGWAPPHKISRAAMDGLRALHAHDPDTFTTPVLSQKFRISPEAVRRILRSKWQPTKEQHVHLLQRERRHRDVRIRMSKEKKAVRQR